MKSKKQQRLQDNATTKEGQEVEEQNKNEEKKKMDGKNIGTRSDKMIGGPGRKAENKSA